ncbi:MAG: helix-turn-helix domain-containing protein [Crocosphaera sp.]|nr:helix-turn-helix domain-containing protein [Crocosphaera sp.]
MFPNLINRLDMFAFDQKSDLLLEEKKLTFRHNHFWDLSKFSRFPKGFAGEVFHVGDENFNCSISQVLTNNMKLGLHQQNSRILFKGCGLDDFIFSFPAFNYGHFYSHKYKINNNTITIIYSHQEMAALRQKSDSNYFINFERKFLDNLCEILELSEFKKQLYKQSIPQVLKVDAQKINYIRRLCHQIYQLLLEITSQSSSSINPLLINYDLKQKLEEEVAKTIIISLAEATEIKLKKQQINRSRILKKAEEFYFSNLKSSITTQDLCQELKVSQRTLEYIFKDYYQMSPKKYFQRLRLNALHQELQEKDKQGNLREITEKFGFYHRGRLAKDYHQLFGQFPSETLRG